MFTFIAFNVFADLQASPLYIGRDQSSDNYFGSRLPSSGLITVCSGTGIVILWNSDCGTEFRICSQITLTDFAESYIRKKGEVEQLSRVGD